MSSILLSGTPNPYLYSLRRVQRFIECQTISLLVVRGLIVLSTSLLLVLQFSPSHLLTPSERKICSEYKIC